MENNIPVQNKYDFSKITSIGLGFLGALALSGFWREFSENNFSPDSLWFILIAGVAGFFVGQSLAKHLSVCSHKDADHPTDFWFIAIVVFGSLIHTVFDGAIVHEGFTHSWAEGSVILFAILGHEIVRTTIFYNVLRTMSFPKKLATLSVFGVSVLGVTLGAFVAPALSLEKYESLAHIISGALFVAVTTDLFYYLKFHNKKIDKWFVCFGALIVVLLQFLEVGH